MVRLKIKFGRVTKEERADLNSTLHDLREVVRRLFPHVSVEHQRLVSKYGSLTEANVTETASTQIRAWILRGSPGLDVDALEELSVTLFTSAAATIEESKDVASLSLPDSCTETNDQQALVSDRKDIRDVWLRMCTKATLGTVAIRQPKFVCTYLVDAALEVRDIVLSDESTRALWVPLCAPCAHTCWSKENVAVVDSIVFLKEPFICGCSRILKSGHRCFWKDDEVTCKCASQTLYGDLRVAWQEQYQMFLRPIKQTLQEKMEQALRDAEPKFTQQLRSAVNLFPQYRDPVAQQHAQRVVPVSSLMNQAQLELERHPADSPVATDIRDELFKQLLHWFKHSFFSWVDNPICSCGGATSRSTSNSQSTSPTPEEVANWATTIEMYVCTACNSVVRFPRYNRAQRLLTWRKGRCGEWTNCFLLIAISLGFECRSVLDFTDHVWVEVYSSARRRWVHCDPCESAFDTPLMYEVGWKKNLSYVFSFSDQECVDVIRRYSTHPLALPARTLVTEVFVNALVSTIDQERAGGAEGAALFVNRRRDEWNELLLGRSTTNGLLSGRTTGSEAWRMERRETGADLPLTLSLNSLQAAIRQLSDWEEGIDFVNLCRSITCGKEGESELFSFPHRGVEVTLDGVCFSSESGALRSKVLLQVLVGFEVTFCCRLAMDQSMLMFSIGRLATIQFASGSFGLRLSMAVNCDGTFHGKNPVSPTLLRHVQEELPIEGGMLSGTIVLDCQGGLTVHAKVGSTGQHHKLQVGIVVPLFSDPALPGPLAVSGRNCVLSQCLLSGSFI